MPERLLRLAEDEAVRLVASDAILGEVAKVLMDEKFAWSEERITQTLRELRGITERVEPTETLAVITADPSDNRILECADAGRADFIVSGDKHLLALKHYRQTPILKVADFLRQLP